MTLTRSIRPVVAVLLSLAQFIPSIASARAIGLPPGDATPPEIIHTPLTEFPAGMPLRVQATVTDNVGISEVTLIYRSADDSEYRRLPMLEAPGSDIYAADLPDAAGPRIEYFIQATDGNGNTTPDQMPEPYVITVTEMETHVAAVPADMRTSLLAEDRGGLNKWLWIGVGVAAVAVLAGGGGSSGGGDTGNSSNSGTGTITITAPVP
jgi:hypothetical protein